ncbi:motility associated factor glycosyltransferase family protein [Clostridium sp. P21]|uniref:Motility associated factor glycosyltransferase family protein n=1 Tax=Clostridium muellerianum TaxID=2716538 RepID=A0A7Y0ED53_9CLOT|nr:6-hydroxymethylpterin diphosphokinase MptE-like protein [Clostridium muellerianum]NMM61284.1 motility associated factor glycosyltransferase family protein [Clostridium muellerianum]
MNNQYYLETSNDGKNIIRVVSEDKKVYIGSKYSVERDINKFTGDLGSINGNTIILVFGLGTGEHIRELLKNVMDSNKVIVIEPSLEIANLFSNIENSKYIISDKRVKMFVYDKKNIEKNLNSSIESCEIDNVKFISFANYSSIFEGEFKQLSTYLRKVIQNKRIGRDTINFFSQILFQNFIRNMKQCARCGVINSYKNLFQGKPAVIVSAGPSLEKNIHLLKDVQDKFIIICGARTLKALKNADITPDFVCAVDPQDITYTIMKHNLDNTVPLVFMDSANYKIVQEYKGNKIMFSNEGMETYVESITGKKVDSLLQGGSVAHVCMGLAIYLGCNPVIFIGQDLAYTGDKFHALSAKAMENPGDVAVTYLEQHKDLWLESEKSIYVKDINGEMVRTSIPLNSYREEFEELMEKCIGITFINSTEGGAHIKGTQVIPLKASIDKYGVEEISKNISFQDTIKKETVENNLKIVKNNLIDIKEACEKGIEYAEMMYMYYIHKKGININKVFSSLDEIDSKINDIQKIGIIAYLLAPYVDKVLNDEKYAEKLNELEYDSGKRMAEKSKSLYECISKAVEEALKYID